MPKQRITKEMVVNAAFSLARAQGMAAVTVKACLLYTSGRGFPPGDGPDSDQSSGAEGDGAGPGGHRAVRGVRQEPKQTGVPERHTRFVCVEISLHYSIPVTQSTRGAMCSRADRS